MKEETIYFYSTAGKYGCFSNFSRHPVYLKELRWPTSEHYFQAQKFVDTPHEEAVRRAHKPMMAANMGRDRKRSLRKDWENIKDDVMREAVIAKFTQNKDIREVLLGTDSSLLVEHTANDRYWADGGDGRGLNKLGLILMEVRDAIRQGKTRYENNNFI